MTIEKKVQQPLEKKPSLNEEKLTPGGVQIQQLFKAMFENNASDLHITVNSPPVMRVYGEIIKVKSPPLSREDTKRLLFQVLSDDKKQELKKNFQIDFSFKVRGLARFRANIYYSQNGLAGAFRLIPNIVPDFKSLNLPNIVLNMIDVSDGLILMTGPTGSGKSTTVASLIDQVNQKESRHIITLEDPIEFVHEHKSSIINQREVGVDTSSFNSGLKSMLRQDPDIVMIGELRDLETMEAALTIAETGHLVFATLHTNSAVQTVTRLINVFPGDRKGQISTLLSFVLRGVVSQKLIRKSFSPGRCLSLEILIPNTGIRNLIRENKTHQIYSQIQIGQELSGMMTMNQSLENLVEKGLIDKETAMLNSTMPDELAQMLGIEE